MGLYLRKSFRLGPLRLNLSTHGIGLSAGVKGARFGVDAGGHPYVHAGRRGLYYRKRWPTLSAAPTRDPLAEPTGPPPPETHGRVGWGWALLAVVLLFVLAAWLMG